MPFLDSLQHGTNHVFVYLASTCYTVLNSKLNHASHLCIKNIIEEKTVQRLVSSFFNTLPIITLSRLCQADFSDNFNQIISCSLFNRHLLWLDSGFGLGHRARGWSWCCILCFLNQQSSPLKSFLSFKMPENANIAKTNHQQPYCSLCLAFALLSTEYAWPFCSWMPNSSSTQIIDHVLTTTVEHVHYSAAKLNLIVRLEKNARF